jgi:hypothetical protein
MSNFLNSLIARASQQAPVLQRRQPALFEPVVPWSRPLAQSGDLSGDPAVEAQPIGPSIVNTASGEANSVRARNASQDAHPHPRPKDSVPLARAMSLLPAESRLVKAASTTTASSINNNAARAIVATVPLARPASLLPAESRPVNAASTTASSVNNNAARAIVATVPLARPASLLPAESRPVKAASTTTASSVNNNAARAIVATVPTIEARAERDLANDLRPVLSNAQPSPDVSSKAVRSFIARQPNPSLVPEDLPRPRTVTARTGISPAPAYPSVKEVQWRDEAATSVLVPAAPKITQAVQLAKTAQPHAAIAFSTTSTEKDSVQITIGRVEVRAVTGSERPAARSAKPTTPRLTLDDYLRDRSGRRP